MEGSRIQMLKATTELRYRELDIGAAIAPKLYSLNSKAMVKMFIIGLFYECKFKLNSSKSKSEILFSRNFSKTSRPDFWDIYRFVASVCHPKLISFNKKFKFRIVFFRFYCFINLYLKNRSLNLTLRETVSVTSLECYFRQFIDRLELLDWTDCQCYMSFCDSYLEENIVTQYAQGKGIKTVTLQHGQYKFTGEVINTDSEAYLNFISDYMLVWGKATEDQLLAAGIPSSRILLSGVPKDLYEKQKPCDFEDSLCIYLNGDDHFDSNDNMVRVCAEYCEERKIDFYVRKHPTSMKKIKQSSLGSAFFKGFLKSEPRLSSMNVVNTSGVVLELLMMNVNVAIFIDEHTNGLYKKLDLKFHNTKELGLVFGLDKDHRNSKSLAYLNFSYDYQSAINNYSNNIRRVLLND